jgi:hypothetical protein
MKRRWRAWIFMPVTAVMLPLVAEAAFDGFEVADGYLPSKSIIGSLPDFMGKILGSDEIKSLGKLGFPEETIPVTDQGWDGPWQNVGWGVNNAFRSSADKGFNGSGSSLRIDALKMAEGSFNEAARALNLGKILDESNYAIQTYAYVPQASLSDGIAARFKVFTGALGGTESAAFQVGGSGEQTWYVWDKDSYIDTGVAVSKDSWTKLSFELDPSTKSYRAFIDDKPVLGSKELSFGEGSGANVTGVGFYAANTKTRSASFYFDDILAGYRPRPKIPEVSTWIALLGFLGAGLLPMWLSQRQHRNR